MRFIKENKGKILGGLAGLLVALLLIFAWPIILTIFLVFLGVLLGKIFDTVNKAHKWMQSNLSRQGSNEEKDRSG